ncbi:hypothetical protein [Nannocystis pusilla]|uniref:hypothetical protein n=1 Tax=Nannocystis pusilla TaxID=889268 RepID=UPI003B7DCA69
MATEHILTRGSDTIRIVHDGCDLVTGEGENSVTQTFDDDAEARSHLDYVLRRLQRTGYGVSSRRFAPSRPRPTCTTTCSSGTPSIAACAACSPTASACGPAAKSCPTSPPRAEPRVSTSCATRPAPATLSPSR